MRLLGKAQLVQRTHESGMVVKDADLTPFGGPLIFLGRTDQPVPTGTLDRGPLRLEMPSLNVYQLTGGEAPPTIGGKGVGALMGFAKWLPLLAGVAAFFWLGGLKMKR